MLASRFVKVFEEDAQAWQKRLANVADVFVYIGEIQRTWSYLEPLFIGSELPEDAKRFAAIDDLVKAELKRCWNMKNVKDSCNQEGLVSAMITITIVSLSLSSSLILPT